MNPSEDPQNIPPLTDVLVKLTTPGTIYSYPEKPIVFKESTQQAVKSLEVTISSTETKDQSLLHGLHTKVRNI